MPPHTPFGCIHELFMILARWGHPAPAVGSTCICHYVLLRTGIVVKAQEVRRLMEMPIPGVVCILAYEDKRTKTWRVEGSVGSFQRGKPNGIVNAERLNRYASYLDRLH